MPARITDPPVGASVWASGSQVCTGKIGHLMAKEAAKARNSQRAVASATDWPSARLTRSKVRVPVAFWLRKTRARIPTSMRAEPSIV